MPPLAHGLEVVHRGPQQGEDRPGVARAVGLQHAQLLHRRESHLGGTGDGAVHLQGGDRQVAVHGGVGVAVHPAAEGGDVLLPDGEARRQLVAAELLQQVRAALQRREQVEAPPGPAGALAHAALQVDHEAGTGILLAEAGGNDAHHPLVPVLAGQHQGAALAGRETADLVNGVGADILLHALALPVELAELPGKLLSPLRVGALQKLRRQVRLPHAPGGVDPGGEGKAHLDGGERLIRKPRLPQQRVEPGEIRVGQGLQPAGNDGPVLPLHQHHIRDGADGGQGAVPGEKGVLPALASQGQNQLQSDAHARQVLEGIRAVRSVGIHHGHRLRKLLPALMVVRYHHVHAQGRGIGHLLHARHAAVHGDEQGGPPLPEPPDGGKTQPVAILHPTGDVAEALHPRTAEVVLQQHRGRDAVHVVVAEDRHGLAAGDRLLDARRRPVHVLHQKGREGELPLPVQFFRGLLRRADTPGRQH